MVEQKEIIGDYWSQRSEGFSEYVMEHLDEDVQGPYLKTVLSYADGKKLKVLDVGCGPGLFSVVLGRGGHDVTAIDCSDGMIAKARHNCAEAGVPANILKMDAQNLEFGDGTFDLIVSRKVVWNLPDPVRAYKEWLRVLKDDGKMILFDGNYFLRMYDDEYKANAEKQFSERKAEFEKMRKEAEVGTAYNQGGDPAVLNSIAEGLPLSRERRPQWDVGVLTELGAKSVRVDIDTFFETERGGETVSLPNTFILTVSKQL